MVDDFPDELKSVPIKNHPQCHRLKNGEFWHHKGDGKWELFGGNVYGISGDEKDVARFIEILDDPRKALQ